MANNDGDPCTLSGFTQSGNSRHKGYESSARPDGSGKITFVHKEGVLDPGIVIGHGKYLKVNALCVGPSAFVSVPLKRCTTALEFVNRFVQNMV